MFVYSKCLKQNHMEHKETMIFSYSDIFFSYYFNNDTRCHKMIENHTLVYVYAGELLVEEGPKKTRIHSGQSVFVRKDVRVTMTKKPRREEQFKAIFMVFNRNFLREFYHSMHKEELPEVVRGFRHSLVKLPETPDIQSLFQSMVPYFDSSVNPSEHLMKLKLQEGVYSLLNIDENFYSCLFDFTEPWKIDILDFMDRNYMYDLSMEDIANYTGRSLATFKRDFKKVSPLPPLKWLIEKRLKVARDKIQNEKLKVSDVYLDVGFKNLSHFSTTFKKQFGHSPTG